MSEAKDKYLVLKSQQYRIVSMEPALTLDGTPIAGQAIAQVEDHITKQLFPLLLSKDMLERTGYSLMGK